ncbi:hypothetical protein NKH77_41375 [Streptomyces sp. M19]
MTGDAGGTGGEGGTGPRGRPTAPVPRSTRATRPLPPARSARSWPSSPTADCPCRARSCSTRCGWPGGWGRAPTAPRAARPAAHPPGTANTAASSDRARNRPRGTRRRRGAPTRHPPGGRAARRARPGPYGRRGGVPGRPHPAAARPEGRALPEELRVGRALRPLKRHRDSVTRHRIDVEATVAALAETGLPDVALRPERERWLDLALVVDDGLSMLLWQRLVADLRVTLRRLGAFRTLRTYGLRTLDGGAPALSRRLWDPAAPPCRRTSSPTLRPHPRAAAERRGGPGLAGRAQARGAGAVGRERPDRRRPHPAPAHVGRVGLRADRWSVTTQARRARRRVADQRPGAPGRARAVRRRTGAGAGAACGPTGGLGTAVGVPGEARRCRCCAAGRARRRRSATGRRRRPRPALPRRGLPGAYRLAAHLAGVAPVSVPVMRLVRATVDWPVDTAHLAEVFLSGLLRPADPAGDGEPVEPRHRVFDFTDAARDALLDAVPTAELLDTGRRIGHRLRHLAGSSPTSPPGWHTRPGWTDCRQDPARSPRWGPGWRRTSGHRRGGAPARRGRASGRGPVPAARTCRTRRYGRDLARSGRDARPPGGRALPPTPRLAPRSPERRATRELPKPGGSRRFARPSGIAPVLGFGETERSVYLVTEALNGRRLSDVLDDQSSDGLPLAELLGVADAIAAILAYAHERHVCHGDLTLQDHLAAPLDTADPGLRIPVARPRTASRRGRPGSGPGGEP